MRVEITHETQFVGQELLKDLSDLRGEPARRGGVCQRTLSVFPVNPLKTLRPERAAGDLPGDREEAVEGGFRGRGGLTTPSCFKEFRNLDSRPYPKSVYEAMQQILKWKGMICLSALTRYLKEEGHSSEVVQTVQLLKDMTFRWERDELVIDNKDTMLAWQKNSYFLVNPNPRLTDGMGHWDTTC